MRAMANRPNLIGVSVLSMSCLPLDAAADAPQKRTIFTCNFND
jgi:hypothetical protein